MFFKLRYPKAIFLILLQFLLFKNIYCQHIDIDSIDEEGHYTIALTDSLIRRNLKYWKPYCDKICDQTNIPYFDSSKHNFHFRLYGGSQIIDVNQTSVGQYTGVIYQWAAEVAPGKEPPTNRFYCLQQSFTDQQTNELMQLWKSSGMDTLAHQERIEGWDTGLDGVMYLLENASDEGYQFRSYWTPHKKSSIAQERLVYSFVDSAFVLAGGAVFGKQFLDNIPFYSWSNDPGRCAVKVTTWSQYRAMKKERKKYLKSKQRGN
ncbi:MAG: hypothetical protein J7497_14800 [Chitinophagaceae bacterium]|nr:hypothetical protein [Chitinophagaceae bacterium]